MKLSKTFSLRQSYLAGHESWSVCQTTIRVPDEYHYLSFLTGREDAEAGLMRVDELPKLLASYGKLMSFQK